MIEVRDSVDIIKITIIVLFSIGLASVSVAQQEEPENQTETPPAVSDITVPGDTFYGFKRLSETVSLAMARAPVIGSPDREARVLSRNADERLREARVLFERNDTERAEQAIQRYSDSMGMAQNRAEASSNNETKEMIAERARNNQEVLQEVSRNVPEQARQGIQNALESSRRAQNALQGRPSEEPGERSNESNTSSGLGDAAERSSGGGGSGEDTNLSPRFPGNEDDQQNSSDDSGIGSPGIGSR